MNDSTDLIAKAFMWLVIAVITAAAIGFWLGLITRVARWVAG